MAHDKTSVDDETLAAIRHDVNDMKNANIHQALWLDHEAAATDAGQVLTMRDSSDDDDNQHSQRVGQQSRP